MVCERIRPILDELAREGPVETETRRRALLHSESCTDCAAYLRMSETLTGAFKDWAAEEGATEAPPRVEAILRAAFVHERVRARVAPTTPVLLGLAAAALLVIAALLSPPRPGNKDSAEGASRATGAPEGGLVPSADEAATFMPLQDADPLAEGEGGEVMRVTLPLSALGDTGWPVNDDGSFQTVEADVLVGEDGLARAVRLAE
jgi:hypothetical protein